MPGVVEVPTLQELNVEEVNVSSAVLKAAAHHYGSQCDKANKEFMLCRWEEKDPRKCLKEGRKVNECAFNFFRLWLCSVMDLGLETQSPRVKANFPQSSLLTSLPAPGAGPSEQHYKFKESVVHSQSSTGADDPLTPAGNVDSGGGDLGRFAGPRKEAGVWRQGPGARGSTSSNLNKGNGGHCWSTLPRCRKHALAAERNPILDFHKATACTGVHGAKTLKQTSSLSFPYCQYSYCSPLTLTRSNKYLR
ncbi:uncharacterized protein LOC107744076 [Sinocyclocheilus rhinocerous]|uniref:Uncharacterized LOC107744076 n=1 Tax=Sinocyclocheilus rhinocerous TaxID=307959 RepID=A0A673NIY0_9TELE|nr:PREDICTED: uncharacterized protein LOC107744076 [Sinocyclocheilus rhinocerous]